MSGARLGDPDPRQIERFRVKVFYPLNEYFREQFGVGIPGIRTFEGVPAVARYLATRPVDIPSEVEWARLVETIRAMIKDEADRQRAAGRVLPARDASLHVTSQGDLTDITEAELNRIYESLAAGFEDGLYEPMIHTPDGSRTMTFWRFKNDPHVIIGIDSNWAPAPELVDLLAAMDITLTPEQVEEIVPRNYDRRPGTSFRRGFHHDTPRALADAMNKVLREFERHDTKEWAAFIELARDKS